jgi:hypothetical protein
LVTVAPMALLAPTVIHCGQCDTFMINWWLWHQWHH